MILRITQEILLFLVISTMFFSCKTLATKKQERHISELEKLLEAAVKNVSPECKRFNPFLG